jgi:hypothetical protein
VGITTSSVGVAVGGSGVSVGGTGVSVGVLLGMAVQVGRGVAVGVWLGSGVRVGVLVGVAVQVGIGVSVGTGVAVINGRVGVWNWAGVGGSVAVGAPEVLVVQGVEVKMAVGRLGRMAVLVGVDDTTAGRVGGMASIPPSGATARAMMPKP